MKLIFVFLLFFLLTNCGKPKTVLICGDHVCINNNEADQYFEENLSIEVKIINKKQNKEIDLVELNLEKNTNDRRQVNIFSKKKTDRDIKTLTNEEIFEIKKKIKKRKKKQKTVKKIKTSAAKNDRKKNINIENKISSKDKVIQGNMDKRSEKVTDVCTILKKCSIDEISKYLLNQGKKKGFPDITTRQ
tara:strand:- start:1598 stop:2164 length:567 start_codon:yes stop_codon:yes gene_type:complete